VKVTVDARWRPAGEVQLQAGRLVFPSVAAGPGVYRMPLVRADGGASSYIGEAGDIGRRHGNYVGGPIGQKTSRRVHLRLIDHLTAGGHIELTVITEATIVVGGRRKRLDLRLKRSRLLVENAALHTLPAAEPMENRPGVGE
jgi:hypothetical protein